MPDYSDQAPELTLRDKLDKLRNVAKVCLCTRPGGRRYVSGVELAKGHGLLKREGLSTDDFLDVVIARNTE